MLMYRILMDARYSEIAAVLKIARTYKGSWAWTVEQWIRRIGARPAMEYVLGFERMNLAARRTKLQQYKVEHLIPCAIRAVELPWWQKRPQSAYLESHEASTWRTCDLSSTGVHLRPLRAWSQWRIQRTFSRVIPAGDRRCRLCGLADETVQHLLVECLQARMVIVQWAAEYGLQEGPPGPVLADWMKGNSPASHRLAVVDLADRLKQECQRNEPIDVEPHCEIGPESDGASSSSSSDESEEAGH